MGDELIRTIDLAKTYGSAQAAVCALEQVNLRVARGEFLAIMGPSGCGKSTLLNMLGALDQPTRGEVWVAGENLAHLKDVDRFRARSVGFVFQLHNLLPTLSALENIEVPMQGQGLGRRARHARAEDLLDRVGLAERSGALPNELSGGQRQRVAIGRALANDPALILADEPTGSLDSQAGDEVLALLAGLNRDQGATILIVTHDRHVAQATQRIVSMRDGRIVADHRLGDPLAEDLRALAESRLGRALLGCNGPGPAYLSPDEQAALRRLLARAGTE